MEGQDRMEGATIGGAEGNINLNINKYMKMQHCVDLSFYINSFQQ